MYCSPSNRLALGTNYTLSLSTAALSLALISPLIFAVAITTVPRPARLCLLSVAVA
jgi:hypothetical protein